MIKPKCVKLALIIPCYNEEDIISDTIVTLDNYLHHLKKQTIVDENSFLLFVDDGSTDATFDILIRNKSVHTRILKLTSNAGHQYALLAGLHYVADKIDCVVSIDADLQQEVGAIEKMLVAYNKGAQIVYGVAKDREMETFLKRNTTYAFHWVMKKMGVVLIKGHSDYRLLSKRALFELSRYKETNLFLRGLFPLINLRSEQVQFDQKQRQKGYSKYSFRKMISLGMNGLTSFSSVPIRIITFIGLGLFFFSMIISINVLIVYLTGKTVPGWASITLPMYFLGGVQLLCLGVIGEYIAKIYKETKQRPHYHIDDIIE